MMQTAEHQENVFQSGLAYDVANAVGLTGVNLSVRRVNLRNHLPPTRNHQVEVLVPPMFAVPCDNKFMVRISRTLNNCYFSIYK